MSSQEMTQRLEARGIRVEWRVGQQKQVGRRVLSTDTVIFFGLRCTGHLVSVRNLTQTSSWMMYWDNAVQP